TLGSAACCNIVPAMSPAPRMAFSLASVLVLAAVCLADEHRSLGAKGCPADAQPLLWKVTKGSSTAYMVGIYNIPSSSVSPIPSELEEALGCADIGYFPTGCSLADTSKEAMGNFMVHCKQYPLIVDRDNIGARLASLPLQELQGALKKLIADAPDDCKAGTSQLEASLIQLQNESGGAAFRNTLLNVYHSSIENINPLWCGQPAGAQTYEQYLRAKLGHRPIYGLEDVSVECQAYQGNSVAQDQSLARTMTAHFMNATWSGKISGLQGKIQEVMQCGDLSTLTQLQASMED
ncbi:unnamed protein product, partial [Polarella glacialis]